MPTPTDSTRHTGLLRRVKALSDRWKGKARTLWELFTFWLMGGVAGLIDLAVFAVCNYWVFAGLRGVDARFWLLDYGAENGGLCALLSFAVSFAVSQAANFFIQRKATFGATNNVLISALEYAAMVVAVYILILWLPTFIGAPIYRALGENLGAIAVKLVSQFVSFLIQFPINKWVIMRREKPASDE